MSSARTVLRLTTFVLSIYEFGSYNTATDTTSCLKYIGCSVLHVTTAHRPGVSVPTGTVDIFWQVRMVRASWCLASQENKFRKVGTIRYGVRRKLKGCISHFHVVEIALCANPLICLWHAVDEMISTLGVGRLRGLRDRQRGQGNPSAGEGVMCGTLYARHSNASVSVCAFHMTVAKEILKLLRESERFLWHPPHLLPSPPRLQTRNLLLISTLCRSLCQEFVLHQTTPMYARVNAMAPMEALCILSPLTRDRRERKDSIHTGAKARPICIVLCEVYMINVVTQQSDHCDTCIANEVVMAFSIHVALFVLLRATRGPSRTIKYQSGSQAQSGVPRSR